MGRAPAQGVALSEPANPYANCPVTRNPDGSRTIVLPTHLAKPFGAEERAAAEKRGRFARTYTMEQLAELFVEAAHNGRTNPLLDRLLTPDEKRQAMAELERMNEGLAELVTVWSAGS